MRILYGVCGEGMGHAIRSAVVADHLISRAHDLLFVTSGRAADYLSKRYPGTVTTVPGLTLAKQGGEIQALDTIVKNAIHQALGAVFESPSAAASVLRFRPQAVISDFEPWSARYARLSHTPLFAVDSIHYLSRCTQPPTFMTRSATIAAAVTAAMVPFADHYFVAPLAFGQGLPLDRRTTLYPPILRPLISSARTNERHDHLTVYLNQPDEETLRALAQAWIPCHVWQSGISSPTARGTMAFLPFEEKAFIQDLATCRAAVGSAASLMGEAAYLQRPMLALPLAGQGEQELNAAHFARDGYGESHPALTLQILQNFLERAPVYQQQLQTLTHDANKALFAALDRALAGVRA